MGEVSTAQKLGHLRQLVKDTKRIDATYPLIYVQSGAAALRHFSSGAGAAGR
jgi:hypothetical protein